MNVRRSAFAALSIVFAFALTTQSFAQAQTPIGQFRDWGAISYNSPNGKVCYALSVPQSKLPTSVNHGDNFFVITQRGSQNVSYEPQFIAGYTLQEGSKVTVNVDGTDFTFFVKDNSAWTENAAQDPALVAAMRAGSRMTVRAVSRRGTNTTYEYSLSGVTAALEAIQSCN
ncbi:MAG: invasion associated locus B family protein [Pseudomonadota bacterium]